MRLLDSFYDVALVASGSILGANTRFVIYQKLEKINLNKNYITLFINIFSSFLCGLLFSILSYVNSLRDSYQLALFFSVGLLGSLSTFSTLIYDLYCLLIKSKFYMAFNLFIISLALGILAFAVGFLLGI